ncbi:MAG: hypothetical protein HW416_1970 [Chloroflexi bacterium]|nr:hypothetical protein [Chloroflexota bacterium]
MRSAAAARVLCISFIVAAGCAPAATAPGRQPGVANAPAADPAGPPKTLIIGQSYARDGLAPWFIMGSGRVLQYEELFSNFLSTTDEKGNTVGRLATKLPTVDDGSLTILPDGRMRTTWQIRPNAKWHDGAPVRGEDVIFGWEVAGHPEIPVNLGPTYRTIDSIQLIDPLTIEIMFKTTYYRAFELGFRDLYPLPKHMLADAFQGDKTAFMNLPAWSNGYIHTGPFRVAEFEAGENLVLQRFDDYFLGRPKLNTIIIRAVRDNNAVYANLRAGAIDIAGELPDDLSADLRDDWKLTGEGFVVSQQGNWRFVSIQFHPEWGGPPELQQDVRTRRGLAFAIDRDAVRSVVVPGYADTEADSFMLKSDPKYAAVGTPFAQYRYDTTRALQELAEAGWRRAADGRMMNAAGRQVQLSLRTTAEYEKELSAISGGWRDLGLDVAQEVTPRPLARDNEWNAKFPSMEISAQANSDGIFRRIDSRLQSTPQNRFVGSNAGHYVNPVLDSLLDRFYSTIDDRQQGALLKEMGEMIAVDLPLLPNYYSVNTMVALKHVKAFDDFAGATRSGTSARNAHLWDRV